MIYLHDICLTKTGGGLDILGFLYIYFVYSNTRIIMQVSQPPRATYASRVQQPFTVSQHPILLSTARPPQQPLQYSTFIPQQVAPMGPMTSRIIQPAASYQGGLPPILYPQYQQPLYPSGQPYLHPMFMAQPVTVVRRPQQTEQSQAYDYEQVNRLCQAKIIENSIFCVVCGSEYKISEKDEHIKKHTRKGQERKVNQEVLHRLEDYHKKQTKQNYLVKPIVQPEELDLHFDPNVFEVIQEIIYQDESMMSKKEAAIGQDANNSFSYFDNNVSIAHNNTMNLPVFDSEPNPFFSKTDKPHEYHVPEFEIPAPPQYEPAQKDQPIIYEDEPIVPTATPINSHPPQIPSNIIEQVHNPPQNMAKTSEPVPIYVPTEVYHSQRLINPKTSLFSKQEVAQHRSQRYESTELKGFPQEELPKMDLEPIQRQESFSGPLEIRPPTEQSKKSTEVNVSQFIRDLNAQNQGLVVQSRKRIPNQSEW